MLQYFLLNCMQCYSFPAYLSSARNLLPELLFPITGLWCALDPLRGCGLHTILIVYRMAFTGKPQKNHALHTLWLQIPMLGVHILGFYHKNSQQAIPCSIENLLFCIPRGTSVHRNTLYSSHRVQGCISQKYRKL